VKRAYRAQHPRRQNRRATLYPPELGAPLSFLEWLEEDVNNTLENDNDENLSDDIVVLSRRPSPHATTYRSMWAFGYHLRVAPAEIHLKTCNSGIAATFRRLCRSGLANRNPVQADLEYVENVQEIVELSYQGLCMVILICSWVRAHYWGPNATVKKDKWGFTVANFSHLLPLDQSHLHFPCILNRSFFVTIVLSLGGR
jgi:hypothetical protein